MGGSARTDAWAYTSISSSAMGLKMRRPRVTETAEDVIRDLRAFAEEHGRAPTFNEWRRIGRSTYLTQKHFGGWTLALRAAGLRAKVPASIDPRLMEIRARYEEGATMAELIEEFHLSESTVRMRVRQAGGRMRPQAHPRLPVGQLPRYYVLCENCGEKRQRTYPLQDELCAPCRRERRRAANRERLLLDLEEWVLLFGRPPSTSDWNPALAKTASSWREKQEQVRLSGRSWPSWGMVKSHFGGWPEFLRAGGYEPLTPSEYPRGYARKYGT